MAVDQIIDSLIRLPIDQNASGKSTYEQLKETGYFEHHEQISQADIYKYIIKKPELIQEWLTFCQNQRSSDGWVFYQRKLKPQYIVRQHINRINTKYDDPAKACSVYIKNQIELVRQI